MTKDELLREIAKTEAEIEVANESWSKSQAMYERLMGPVFVKLDKLNAELSIIEDEYETEDGVAEGAEIIGLDEFKKAANDGFLTDSDGFGFYIKDNKQTDIQIMPSWVNMGKFRKDMDEIAWFNKG